MCRINNSEVLKIIMLGLIADENLVDAIDRACQEFGDQINILLESIIIEISKRLTILYLEFSYKELIHSELELPGSEIPSLILRIGNLRSKKWY